MDLRTLEVFWKGDFQVCVVEVTKIFFLGGVGSSYLGWLDIKLCLSKPTLSE